MIPFHLNPEEIRLISNLRCLTGEQRDMVAYLISKLEALADHAPIQATANVTALRIPPSL
jgi:hypothetical protein